MAYLGNWYSQSVMVAFIFDWITMGRTINIISHNVKLAAHKSFYNLATMAVKGKTGNKFNFFAEHKCATG